MNRDASLKGFLMAKFGKIWAPKYNVSNKL